MKDLLFMPSSRPWSRFYFKIVLAIYWKIIYNNVRDADVAQSVEHFIGNEEAHGFDSRHQLQFAYTRDLKTPLIAEFFI